jgi:hypothetical protein
MDVEQLNSLEKIPLQHAQVMAISMLNPKTKALRLNRLKHDIQKARTSREVMRIMWKAYLAGTGYAVTSSDWQKQYGNAQ